MYTTASIFDLADENGTPLIPHRRNQFIPRHVYPEGLALNKVTTGTVQSATSRGREGVTPAATSAVAFNNRVVRARPAALLFEQVKGRYVPVDKTLKTNTELNMELVVHPDGVRRVALDHDHAHRRRDVLRQFRAQIDRAIDTQSPAMRRDALAYLLHNDPQMYSIITAQQQVDPVVDLDAEARANRERNQLARAVAQNQNVELRNELANMQGTGLVSQQAERLGTPQRVGAITRNAQVGQLTPAQRAVGERGLAQGQQRNELALRFQRHMEEAEAKQNQEQKVPEQPAEQQAEQSVGSLSADAFQSILNNTDFTSFGAAMFNNRGRALTGEPLNAMRAQIAYTKHIITLEGEADNIPTGDIIALVRDWRRASNSNSAKSAQALNGSLYPYLQQRLAVVRQARQQQ